MKDIFTRLSENLAQRYANITDDNEMVSEMAVSIENDKKKRIEDIEAQIAALQEEIKQIKAADTGVSLEEIEKKMKRSTAAKKAAETRRKNREYWDRRNSENSYQRRYEPSYSCGSSGWGYGRSSC